MSPHNNVVWVILVRPTCQARTLIELSLNSYRFHIFLKFIRLVFHFFVYHITSQLEHGAKAPFFIRIDYVFYVSQIEYRFTLFLSNAFFSLF